MSKIIIKKIDEQGVIEIFNDIKSASKSIESGLDDWKVQMLIADAINTNKRAFKCKWKKVLN